MHSLLGSVLALALFPVELITLTSFLLWYFYRPKRSFGQGYVFTGVCDSVHRGGSGKEIPPAGWRTPPPLRAGWRTPPAGRRTPQRGWMENPPPGWMENPPPSWKENPPIRKQTPANGLRSAGTHPTGMHSCITSNRISRRWFSFCDRGSFDSN